MEQTGTMGNTAGARHPRLGDILVAGGFVLPSELASACKEQRNTARNAHLGAILVGQGGLENQELNAVLRVQDTFDHHHSEPDFRLDAQARSEAHVRLGDLLVENGDIDNRELQDALAEQRRTHLPLGEVLVSRGSVSQHQLDRVVGMQRRLLGAVFSIGLAMASLGEAQASSVDGEAVNAAPTAISQSVADDPPTLDELLPSPEFKALTPRSHAVVDSAAVSLRGFVQNVGELFDKVEFSGMESHFGAMDANTARDREQYDITDSTYIGLTFKVNFSEGGGKKGDKDVNLNFLPDDY